MIFPGLDSKHYRTLSYVTPICITSPSERMNLPQGPRLEVDQRYFQILNFCGTIPRRYPIMCISVEIDQRIKSALHYFDCLGTSLHGNWNLEQLTLATSTH
ncbi:hypothetical protein M758_1G115200 [Ceratodon purpureus]|nr:hypothetical protein M758_1G115200 [Ceratodon purpureus]